MAENRPAVQRSVSAGQAARKWLRYFLFALGALVLLVAGVAAYIALTFDPNAHKPELERLVHEKTGRVLSVEGDIGLAFFPKLGLELGRTRLSEADGKTDFAVVNEVQVALALLPLLARRVVVDEVVIDGLQAQVVKRADGTSNLDDLMRGDASPPAEEEAPPQEDAARVALDVEGVRVTNAVLVYRDEASGGQYRLSGLTLQTGRFAPPAPMPFSLETNIEATQPAVAITLRAKGEVSVDPQQRTFQVKAAQASAAGKAAGVGLERAELTLPVLELHGANQAMRLEGLSLAMTARQARDRIDIQLSAPVISLSNQSAEGAGAQLTFKLQGAQRAAQGTLSLSGLSGTRQALKVTELNLTLDADQAGSSVRGRLATPLEGNLDTMAFTLPRIGGKFDVKTPALPEPAVLSVTGTARATLSEEKAEIDLSGKLDQSNFQGTMRVAKFDPPQVRFDFSMDQLDADRYLVKQQPGEAERQPRPAAGATQETPIDLSALKTLNLDGRVQLGQLKASGVTVSKVRADVKANNGQVRIEPLSANLYDGSLRGALAIDAHRQRFTVKQTLSKVKVGPLLRDALSQDLLAGRGDVVIDAVATGNTVSELKRSLSGQTKVSLQDGAIKGINLAEILRKAKSLLTGGQDTEHAAAQGEQTDFSEFKAGFVLKDGKARNDDLSMKSPFLRLAGGGEIDLLQLMLDYRVQTALVASSKGQGGRELEELAGLTLPVHITGPLTAPKFKLEWRSALRGSAETRLEEKKEALKERLKDRLQERLGEPESAPPAEEGAAGSPPPAEESPKEEVKRRLKDLIR